MVGLLDSDGLTGDGGIPQRGVNHCQGEIFTFAQKMIESSSSIKGLHVTRSAIQNNVWPSEYADYAYSVIQKSARILGVTVRMPDKDFYSRIIQYSYLCSQILEEGRSEPFRIVLELQPINREYYTRYTPHIDIRNPRDLRKLTSTAPYPDFALCLSGTLDNIVCKGVINVATQAIKRQPLLGARFNYSRGGLVMLHIQAPQPGVIQISNTSTETYEYSAGTTRILKGLHLISDFRRWHDGIANSIKSMVSNSIIGCEMYVREYFVRMLSWAIEKRHGGMFVIADKSPEDKFKRLVDSCKVRLRLDIKDKIVNYFKCGLDAENTKDIRDYTKQLSCNHDIINSIKYLVGCSQMDGAVLIDRDMVLHGCGMEISYTGSTEEMDIKDEDESVREASAFKQQYGMRHRSAYRCCVDNPSAMVIVISQDGGLSYFAQSKEENIVRAIRGLKPIMF